MLTENSTLADETLTDTIGESSAPARSIAPGSWRAVSGYTT
jgi:hypothetical protein